MKKTLIILFFFLIARAHSQCLTATNGQYPATAYSPNCNGVVGNITTCAYASEYAVVNVVAGVTYTFSSSVATDIITIGNAGGTVALTFGTGTVVWTSTVTGTIRFYNHTAGCGAQSTCRTKSMICSTPPTGCLTATNGQFPAAAFSPACTGTAETITTCGYASEYSVINVVSGVTYTFTSSIGTDVITISNAAGTTVLTFGTGTVVWTSTVTGTIRFYTHTSGCGAQSTCRTKSVICGTPPPPTSSNCSAATQVCSDASFAGNSSGAGTQELNAGNQGCLSTEHQSSWYIFQASGTGTLALTITTSVDYDFAIWGPNASCGALGTPIRCSFAAGGGNTGLGNGATDASETAFGDRWVSALPLVAGQTYILLIDNFTANSTPFTLDWTMSGGASLNCTPLPIELLYFNGEKRSCGENVLTWATATEINNDKFEIERSNDGLTFNKIKTIAGSGNSTNIKTYNFNDNTPEDLINYYRLKQIDFDGQYKYSHMVDIDNTCFKNIKILKITNLLGQEVESNYEGVRIIHYSDGTAVKKVGL